MCSLTVLSNREIRARKPHTCDICREPIERGTIHHVQASVQDGRVDSWRGHLACYAICLQWMRDNDEDCFDLEIPGDLGDWTREKVDACLPRMSPSHPERERARRLWQERWEWAHEGRAERYPARRSHE